MIKEVEVGSHTNMCNDSTSYFIVLKECVRFGLIMRRLCEKKSGSTNELFAQLTEYLGIS